MAEHEYEAKFLAVDVTAVRDQLRNAGAEQVFSRTLFSRLTFDTDPADPGRWVRLRDEGGRTTLTLKQVRDASRISGTLETEIEVSDLAKTAEILAALGLRQRNYQQNYREEWRLGEVVYDLDTWPGLSTFLEIEGPDEEAVRAAAAELKLPWEQARFGSIDLIYRSELDRDILKEPTLLFI